jgi:hypothetical protein
MSLRQEAATLNALPGRSTHLSEAVVLLQASAESWINRLYEINGVRVRSKGWLSRWDAIGRAAVALGRPMRSLSIENRRLLDDVSIMRNFLVHGDRSARKRLENWSGGADLHDVLTVAWVEELFQKAEALWAEVREITGQTTPSTDHAWVAWDEIG